MALRKYFIKDPGLDEYIFHVMRLSSVEQRSNLNPEELFYFNREANMRQFADNETLDKRLLMLTRLGYSYTLIVSKHPADIEPLLKETGEAHTSGSARKAAIEQMIAKKVFVLSSRDVLLTTHLMAMNTHSQVFTLDYAWVQLNARLNAKRVRPFNAEVTDAINGTEELAKIALSVLATTDIVESLTGCSEYEIQILLSLYLHRYTTVSTTALSQLMAISCRTTGISNSCVDLFKRGYILRLPGPQGKNKTRNSKYVYMIADQGIDAVLKYLKYIHKQL